MPHADVSFSQAELTPPAAVAEAAAEGRTWITRLRDKLAGESR